MQQHSFVFYVVAILGRKKNEASCTKCSLLYPDGGWCGLVVKEFALNTRRREKDHCLASLTRLDSTASLHTNNKIFLRW